MQSKPDQSPLRVDFAGGWLDVPRFARGGAYVVNCAISPAVSLADWPYEKESGLGGSGAWHLLNGRDGVAEELKAGAGWQDPAVIQETGVCVWRSGDAPVLDFKSPGDWLAGCMALYWTGKPHHTAELVDMPRDYHHIGVASHVARRAVLEMNVERLQSAVEISHNIQICEGMAALPHIENAVAKYCGSGHGGYALYLFSSPEAREDAIALPWSLNSPLKPIEPYYLKRHG